MVKNLKAFLTRMGEDTAFAKEVAAKGKSLAEAEKISDDRELAVRVGKEMGYEFTVDDIKKGELEAAKKTDTEMTAAKAEEMLNEDFELSKEALDAVAGGCDETFHPHDWVFVGKEEGRLWGYNLNYRCRKCGKEKSEWEKWPWEELFD